MYGNDSELFRNDVLCLYLLWSFLSFAWERTWVIWPLAVLIHWLIRKLFEGEPVNAKA